MNRSHLYHVILTLMNIDTLINLLGKLEGLKNNTRHSWTSTGRRESVAEHTWRMTMMAWLLRDEFPDINMDEVILTCLVHDWGEAITGDVPSFYKTDNDEESEDAAVNSLLALLPEKDRLILAPLFDAFSKQSTPEARLARALDKLEVVLQHNEASLDTWLPIEYNLNQDYAESVCREFPYLQKLQARLREDSREKLVTAGIDPDLPLEAYTLDPREE